jgi:hypothetical protein
MGVGIVAGSRRREVALDVFRGACVISMTLGHLAPGSLPFEVTHSIPWFDGASGFVLLAGLVLGMVHERRYRTGELSTTYTALAKRTAVLYLNHITLVLLALLTGSLTRAAWYLPDAQSEGGWWEAVGRTLTLRLNPPGIDILSMYLILLVAAAIAIALLSRRSLALLAIVSGSVYIVAQLLPVVTTLPGYADGPVSGFNSGAWQLLFISALVAGWHWEGLLRTVLTRWPAVACALTLGVMLKVVDGALTREASDWFFNKDNAGPGWLVMAWVVFVVLYWAMSKVPRLVKSRPFTPLAAIGRRSLDSFVLMTCALILAPAVIGQVPTMNQAIVAAGCTLCVMYAWALARDAFERRPGKPLIDTSPPAAPAAQS